MPAGEETGKKTMNRLPKKPPAGSTPMSEWLTLMLAEIERKDAEASAAADERDHRVAPASREPQSG